jgi:hypothetical protein
MQAAAKLANELKHAGIGGDSVKEIAINITGGSVQGALGGNISIGSMTFAAPSTTIKS